MKKYILILLFLSFLFFGFSTTKVGAITLDDLQAQLKSLTAQISLMKSQLAGQVINTITCSSTSLIGDVNGSGYLNAVDADIIDNIVNGTISAPVGTNQCCYDVDGNGTITSNDADLILNYFTGATPAGLAGQAPSQSCLNPINSSTGVWTAQISAGAANWRSVASSADGMKLVAIDSNGSLSISNNGGISWTKVNSNNKWNYVAMSTDGSKLVATTSYTTSYGNEQDILGRIYTSVDGGTTWTERGSNLGNKNNFTGVASSTDGTKLVAVAGKYPGAPYTVTNYIYTSSDSGITWIRRDSAGARDWSSIASSADGMKLVAIDRETYIYTSIDGGTTWTERRGAGRTSVSVASSADGMKLVAAGNYGRYIYTSTDGGVTWIKRNSSVLSNKSWKSVASSADGMKLVAIDFPGNVPGSIFKSNNGGATWTEETNAGKGAWSSVASSASGANLIVSSIPFSVWNYCNSSGCGGLQAYYPGYLYIYGEIKAPKVLTTTPATVGTNNLVTLKGFVNTDNITRGFEYNCSNCSANQNGAGLKTFVESGNFHVGSYSANISSLLPNKTYNYRAYATNALGVSYGEYATFTTGNGPTPIVLPTDLCANIAGIQTTIPTGMVANGNQCVTSIINTTDLCANIAGIQTTIPTGMIAVGTNCMSPIITTTDLCTNIAGIQTIVPSGMIANNGICTTIVNPPPTTPQPEVLKLGMVSEAVKDLQIWLNKNGYTVASTGPGSLGNESTEFGKATQEAVIRFQKAKGIKPDGVVGQDTLALMK